jgi:hypothetical protein
MTLMIFPILFFSNAAFACVESPRLSELLNRELVFEGRLVAYEKTEHVDPKDQSKIFYNLVEVYKVDRNWKGTKKGQEIRITPFGAYSKDGYYPENSLLFKKQIITVAGDRTKANRDIYFDQIDCPDTFDLTWINRLTLFFKYPSAVFQ